MIDISSSNNFIGTFESYYKGYYSSNGNLLFPYSLIDVGWENDINKSGIPLYLNFGYALLYNAVIEHEGMDYTTLKSEKNVYHLGGVNLNLNLHTEIVILADRVELFLHPTLSQFRDTYFTLSECRHLFNDFFNANNFPPELISLMKADLIYNLQ